MEFGDLFFIGLLALWGYCLFDVIRTPDGQTENLPKPLWLLIVIFLGPIGLGSLAWLLLGRPRSSTFKLPTTAFRRETVQPAAEATPTAPPADDDFRRKREAALERYRVEREAELRRREDEAQRRLEELRKRDQGSS